MRTTLALLLENGLDRNGLKWNGKVYGNAIYLNGDKVVLPKESLELANYRFDATTKHNNDVKNNVAYCKNVALTVEDTTKKVKEKYEHYKLDFTTEEAKKEVEDTILARKQIAFNELIQGIGGLLTNDEKEVRFNELVSFIMGE